MQRLFLFWFIVLSFNSVAQSLEDINYAYQYHPIQPIQFQLFPVKYTNQWKVFFKLTIKEGGNTALRDYIIHWEWREGLNIKTGKFVQKDSLLSGQHFFEGVLSLPDEEYVPGILSAKIVNKSTEQTWYDYISLTPTYPTNIHLKNCTGIEQKGKYFKVGSCLTVWGATTAGGWVFRYINDFPAAVPIFAEAQVPVSSGMQEDSVFLLPAEGMTFSKPGLYLVQQDTVQGMGYAFQIFNDYPKYSRLQQLVDPLIYVSTKEEYDQLQQVGNDKRAFDRIVLSMVKDVDRAKRFMRNYYRRVALANTYFTSYKEGWKTDRGMVYIIFGIPDEVFRHPGREVWNYNNLSSGITFEFVASPTLFDPDNFVLIRKRRYQQAWYQVIDMWRDARF